LYEIRNNPGNFVVGKNKEINSRVIPTGMEEIREMPGVFAHICNNE